MSPKFRRASLTSKLHGMQQQANPMWGTWCLGLIFFEGDIGFDTVVDVIKERLLPIPRYRSQYSFERHGFIELEDDQIDIDYHVQQVTEKVEFKDVMQEYVGNVYKTFRVDYDKPLWRYSYFPNLADGRSLIICNVHHVIGDGVSQLEVLYKLMDPKEVSTAIEPVKEKKKVKKKKKSSETYGLLNKVSIAVGGFFGAFTSVFATPDSSTILMRKDPTKASDQKNIAFTTPLPLEKIKEIKEKFNGATVNDVLVALLTMTIRSYLIDQGATDAFKQTIRASFPINARKRNEHPFRDGSPHNKLALGLMKFPFNYNNRSEVIYKVKRIIDGIKLSPEPFVQKYLGDVAVRVLSPPAASEMFAGFGNQTTAMLSNVMGPNEPLVMKGNIVEDIQFGLYSSNGLYLGMISYNGKVSCGITMDDTLGDPNELAKHWEEEFNALYEEVMQFEGDVPKPTTIRSYVDKM